MKYSFYSKLFNKMAIKNSINDQLCFYFIKTTIKIILGCIIKFYIIHITILNGSVSCLVTKRKFWPDFYLIGLKKKKRCTAQYSILFCQSQICPSVFCEISWTRVQVCWWSHPMRQCRQNSSSSCHRNSTVSSTVGNSLIPNGSIPTRSNIMSCSMISVKETSRGVCVS